MARNIVDYIKNQLNNGYDINTIKDYLLKSGYSSSQIDEAINSASRGSPHKLAIMIVIIVIIMSGVLLGVIYFMDNKGTDMTPAKTLKYEISGTVTTVSAGGVISFTKKFTNFDSAKTINIEHKIQNANSQQVVVTKTESGLIRELSGKTEIEIPNEVSAGSYILRSVAVQDNQKRTSSLNIKITEEDAIPTPVTDHGNDIPEDSCPESCDDNMECTEDVCSELTGFECRHNQIRPCCGNYRCETGEDNSNCAADCVTSNEPVEIRGLSTWDKLEKIKEIATTDGERAASFCAFVGQQAYIDQCLQNIGEVTAISGYCESIKDDRTRDTCLKKVAEKSDNKEICDMMKGEYPRDSCYMNFVINKNDYEICSKISNQYLRQSCDSLKQLSEIKTEAPVNEPVPEISRDAGEVAE